MDMKKLYILLASVIGLSFGLNAQCGPGVPDVTCTESPAYPRTCSDTIPDGMAGEFYQHDITMWFPREFFEPSAGLTVTMEQIDILSVSGLPFGMSWTPNPGTVYPEDNEFTAIRVCGTPFNSGHYNLTISIKVIAGAFGITQTVNQNVPVHLYIAPSTQGNTAFATTNPSGCTPLASSFATLFPSNGNSGYSYFWDLGNGFSTTLETPPAVDYATGNNDTFFVVSHTVSIDTIGYYLNAVQITNHSCTENPGNVPDIYMKIFDGQGTEVFNNISSQITANPPINFTLNLHLTNPPYLLQVWDDDDGLLGGDDNCVNNQEGSNAGIILTFPPNEPGGTFTQIGTNGGLIINYTLFKPVIEISGTDTIFVYPNPSQPTITGQPGLAFCENTSTQLVSTEASQYQWYKADTLQANATQQQYTATQPGNYVVEITNEFGCKAISDTVVVNQLPAPQLPGITFTNGLLQTDLTNPPFQLQWFYEGVLFAGQTGQTCVPIFDGMYHVRAENSYGCFSYSDTIEVGKVGLNSTAANTLEFGVYPNPSNGQVTIQVEGKNNTQVAMAIYNVTGSLVEQKLLNTGKGITGSYNEVLDISALPKGVYAVVFNYGMQQKTVKLFVF